MSAARARAAANQQHVAAAVDRAGRQTDGRADGHPTVTQTLKAYYAASVNNCKKKCYAI